MSTNTLSLGAPARPQGTALDAGADGRPLSVVIPAYNEAARIAPTLMSIAEHFSGQAPEVIVVDDGSLDGTADVVRRCRAFLPGLQVVALPENRGKGHAVRVGMLHATGHWRLMMDADGSTDIRELARLQHAASTAAVPIAIASIAVAGADVLRPQAGLRPALGRLANRLIQKLVLPGVQDSQRGFKLFRGDVADDLFGRSSIDGWGFDVEILALARARGHGVVEVGVRWEHRDDSRVRPSSYLSTLAEVVRVRRMVRSAAAQPAAPPLRPEPVTRTS